MKYTIVMKDGPYKGALMWYQDFDTRELAEMKLKELNDDRLTIQENSGQTVPMYPA